MFQASQGTRALGLAAIGEKGRGTRHCRSRQRQYDRADAQKNTLQPHRRQQWVIPPKANSAFVAAMEDVLAVYTRAARSRSAAGLSRRDLKATHCRNARADPDEGGATRLVSTTSTSATG